MLPEERDPAYLWDMLEAAKEADEMLAEYDLSAFLADRVMLRAIERIIEIIGESARRVSTDYQKTHPEIHWHEIIGQRNILAHEYGQINHELLYKTATDDLPKLITIIESLLPPL
ncbi:Protein of unknown function DUF86, BT0167 group [hydrothermal vent metagenome]|uniref:DUF86 domain-containing protein n=1 Tax=hydrothermal vent metagenome TaxID=652676 RepID=A0A3B0W961_9ZZZZ